MSPDQLHKQIKGDLDCIVMKSLEKDRSNRYESAADFSRDVNNYLRDEPILARPHGTWYRSTKALKRHKVFFASAGAIAATLLIATGISIWQATRAHRNAEIARQEAHRANAAETRAIGEVVRANQIAQDQALLLEKHRDVLTEIALMYAFDADVDGANRIAGVLHELEGSQSQAHLIEGVAAFYSGRIEPAKRSFVKALAEDRGNVSAAAMLSVLATYAGNERANEMQHDALQMEPRSRYQVCDKLFLAYALGFQNPQAAVERLRELVKVRPSSPIIRAHLAAALADLASYKDLPDQRAVALEHVNEAWPHLEIARESSRDNFIVAFADLFVHVVAIRLSMLSAENTPDPSLVLKGRQLCERVLKNREFGTGTEMVAWFHELTKSQDLEMVYEHVGDLGGVRGISCISFARGDKNWDSVFTEEVMASVMGRTLRGILAAAEPRRDDEQVVNWSESFDALEDISVALDVLHIPLLLGDLDIVQQLCKERMKSDPPQFMAQGINTRFSYSRLRYLADGLDDSWLLKEARLSGERLEAHFQIAMRYLAQRDFPKAQIHLERAFEVFGPWSNEYHWARAVLGRIADPSWQRKIRRAGIKAEPARTGNEGTDD